MLIINRKLFTFKIKNIYFSDYPFDVEGSDVVNFLSCKNLVDIQGFTCVESFTSVIDLTQDLDTIWSKFDKKSTRYEIKRAQRDGVKYKINEAYDKFYKIYNSFIRQKGIAPLFGFGIIKLETIKRYGTLFIGENNGEVLGGHVYLEDPANLRLWISASKRLNVDKKKASLISHANRLLHWEAIKYAKEKGIKEFDWGGLWSDKEANKDEKKKAINSFKQSFGGEIVTRYDYQKIYSKSYKPIRYLYKKVSNTLKRK